MMAMQRLFIFFPAPREKRYHVVTGLLARFGIGPHVNDTALPPVGAWIGKLVGGGEGVENMRRSRKDAK